MLRDEHPLTALHTFTLKMAPVPTAEDIRASISASVNYLIWTVQTAADDEELRTAKAMLEQAIELYVDEVSSRLPGQQAQT